MNQTPILNFRDFIAADGELLTTTSLQVAAVFGKVHADVLKRVRGVIADLAGQRQGYFTLTFHDVPGPNGSTRQEAYYCITRDGFTLLAMGFTGIKALGFKLAYIDAFNSMAAYIKNQRDGLSYRCMEKELECKDSVRRGEIHGRGLNVRRLEKAALLIDMAALMAEAQRPLNLN